ncbi:OmpA family protein [Dongia sp.]|jgi:outer membrane protein OmpA-like peptidoglycan-associated protein|uniref:OmpA family protein n=1 Tax=Dongia sp. TaxID=1977262 RepID=UPI0035B1895A
MNRYFKLALLGSALLAVTACAAPNREPDLSNIQANVDKTYEGDFGELLYNLNQAGDKARTAEEIKASIDADAPYLYTNLPLRQEGVKLAEEAAEHRAKAEAALNRFLDPIRARLAYLESLHVPQDVGPQKTSVYFDTGSAKIRESEAAAMTDAGNFLSQYPIAHVQIDAYTDTVGSANANKALAQRRAKAVMAAMSEAGVPLAADVSVKAVGEADGADNTESQENRRVDIIVQPHGTYNKGM